MTYSDLYQKESFKIPSVLAITIVAALSFLVSNFFLSEPISTRAVKKNVISLDVTNISSTRANIVWRTSEKELGIVLFGISKNKLSSVAQDERDTVAAKSKYFNHSVSLTNLQPNINYFYSLTNEKELLSVNESTVFSFKTPNINSRINSLKPAYGTVTSPNGSPVKNALVILRNEGNIPLSALSKNSGEWLVPLNGMLNATTLSLSTPALTSKITIQLYDENGTTSTVKAPLQLVSPVADPIKMGVSYVLPEDTAVLGATTEIVTSKQRQKLANDRVFKLTYPENDAIIPVGNPLIKGEAPPISNISVIVRSAKRFSDFVSKSTTSDSLGNWKITLSRPLIAGSYMITAKIENDSSSTISRSFNITKSGEQVLGEATGSAQLTSTPTPASQSAVLSPTAEAEPTEITPTLPATGGGIAYLMYSSAALIVLGLGLMFAF